MSVVGYMGFSKYWNNKGIDEEDIEEWWIDWHDIHEEADEWDNPRRFEILDQFVVSKDVCESAFKKS